MLNVQTQPNSGRHVAKLVWAFTTGSTAINLAAIPKIVNTFSDMVNRCEMENVFHQYYLLIPCERRLLRPILEVLIYIYNIDRVSDATGLARAAERNWKRFPFEATSSSFSPLIPFRPILRSQATRPSEVDSRPFITGHIAFWSRWHNFRWFLG
jgi:hypothetical protein